MSLSQGFLLFAAAVLAGALNGIAGGGSFISFPMLLFTGVAPISANATNNLATGAGTFASVGAYWFILRRQRSSLLLLIPPSLIGSALGSLLLLSTPPALFTRQIPYLLLIATLLFAFSEPLKRQFRIPSSEQAKSSRTAKIMVVLLQLAISIYGGFFGAGMGILMLAALSLVGIQDVHQMNAIRTVLASVINGVALIPFILAGVILWPQAILMAIGALLGGYWSAYFAQKLPPRWVKGLVILTGVSMTLYFFLRTP